MADPKFPYVRWRAGRPRSSHSQWQRRRGFVDEDLRHPDGRWFSLEEAAAFSDRRVKEVAQSRLDRQVAVAAAPRPRLTVAHMLADWQASDEFKALSSSARLSYEKGINAILYTPETRQQMALRRKQDAAAKLLGMPVVGREREAIADVPPSSIGKPELRAFYNYLKRARGHHMAIAVISTLSAAMTWACESTLWRLKSNPRLDMAFDRPEGRIVLVTMAEFQAWTAAADLLGRPSIGDSLYLALFTGQRQRDRLLMRDASDAEGRHAFRQSKTGELVDIKEAPQLTARLAAARARVAAIKLRLGLKDMPAEIVVNEANGQPYDESTYRHWIAATRALAIFGALDRMAPADALARAARGYEDLRQAWPAIAAAHPIAETSTDVERQRALEARGRALQDWLADRARRDSNGNDAAWRLPPCPSLLFVGSDGETDAKRDQDLRDTCVMLLDRAGCDLLTICDITGHSYKSAQTIVKHYRARNPQRADSGIDRLVLQVRKEGLAG